MFFNDIILYFILFYYILLYHIIMCLIISADPCRQQGERIRGGLTSNKGRKEKIGQARFEACDRVLGPELTAGKGKVWSY